MRVGSEEVIELIRERIRSGLQGPFEDGRKLALVLEGGGMKAAAAAGGALALDHLGAGKVFDDVYATSAAVMNASYLISGQGDLGIRVYFEDLLDTRFYHPLRLWKQLDVGYVVGEVATRSKPLDCDRVRDAFPTLHVAAMDRDTGEAITINTKESGSSLLELLHAAMAIPVFYNRSVEIGGRRLVDGGLQIPFPFRAAIEEGATDILVLLSHTADYVHPAPARWQQWVFDQLFARGNESVSEVFATHHLVSRELRDLAIGRSGGPDDVNVFTLTCPEEVSLGTMTMDRAELRDAAIRYGQATLKAFGVDDWASWELGPAPATPF